MKTSKNVVWKAGQRFERVETEIFHPQDQDLLVKIEAISVNPVDYKIREWKPGSIVGWDSVGIVEEVGTKVKSFKKGDRVYYAGEITRSGSYADFQLVDQRLVSLAPKSIPVSDIAAIPLTAITAWECLFDRMNLDR